MAIGITRREIMKKLPDLRFGSFYYFCAKAGVKKVGEQPNTRAPHLREFLYSPDAVGLIMAVMPLKNQLKK